MTSKKHTKIKGSSYKRWYDHQWYLANRMYKKTYARFRRRSLKFAVFSDEMLDPYGIALEAIISDRCDQVKSGRWLDERSGRPYTGVKVDD